AVGAFLPSIEPLAAVQEKLYGSAPPKPAPTRSAGWPIFTNELSPASATSGFAAGAPPPEPALVPFTVTVPDSGFLTEPLLTDWPPTLVTAIEGVAASADPASRNSATAAAAMPRRVRLMVA